MEKIKVIIADDSDFVRDGMRIILSVDDEFEVVGCAKDGQEALTLAAAQDADVILMDIQMPGMDGIAATAEIVRRSLGKVLILTTFDDYESVEKALKNGASGYLIKNHAPDTLKQMIKSIHQGVNVLDEKVFAQLTGTVRQAHGGFDAALFTTRELDIIKEIAAGLSNREIAEKLFISEGTIKNYISTLLDKSGCSHRTQLAVYYLTGKRREDG